MTFDQAKRVLRAAHDYAVARKVPADQRPEYWLSVAVKDVARNRDDGCPFPPWPGRGNENWPRTPREKPSSSAGSCGRTK